jgi:hypothetical protein
VPLPVYRYRQAGYGLLTRRQLNARGLSAAGAECVGEIRWRRGRRVAYLYDPATARPLRPMTPGRWRSHRAMMRARRTCPRCRTDRGYVIPRSLGCCWPCHTLTEENP